MECLLEQDARCVFGYPGGSILGLYDALLEYRGKIRHVLTTHEQHACHAASGYARATGRVGVVFATSGPGATNLVTGIADAYMDSVPLVAITCNVPTDMLGKDSFQEVDIAGITMPVTKHNVIVKDVHHLAETLRMAFSVAASGRPGPVLVDIPKDVTEAICEFAPEKALPPPRRILAVEAEFLAAEALLLEAERPVVIAGGGVVRSDAAGELLALAERLGAPVVTTLMGVGVCPPEHPLYAGMVGMYGTYAAARAVEECDLLIAVGMRFSDRTVVCAERFAADARVLHLDVDAAEINKNVAADLSLLGDAKCTLSRLLARPWPAKKNPLAAQLAAWRERKPASQPHETLPAPEEVLSLLARLAGPAQRYATEVGKTRCGRRRISASSVRGSFLPRADSAPWEAAWARRLARRLLRASAWC